MIDFYPDHLPVLENAIVAPVFARHGLVSAGVSIPLIVVAAAPARPPHLAEREELDIALAAGTTDALLLFIERHPNSRYRAEAEAGLRRLGLTPPQRQ